MQQTKKKMEITESEYNELTAARDWKAAHEQELADLRDFRAKHEEADADEQVKTYLRRQAERDKERAERTARLRASFQ